MEFGYWCIGFVIFVILMFSRHLCLVLFGLNESSFPGRRYEYKVEFTLQGCSDP